MLPVLNLYFRLSFLCMLFSSVTCAFDKPHDELLFPSTSCLHLGRWLIPLFPIIRVWFLCPANHVSRLCAVLVLLPDLCVHDFCLVFCSRLVNRVTSTCTFSVSGACAPLSKSSILGCLVSSGFGPTFFLTKKTLQKTSRTACLRVSGCRLPPYLTHITRACLSSGAPTLLSVGDGNVL